MKEWIHEYLICPECLPRCHCLELTAGQQEDDDIIEGWLVCPQCRKSYAIRDGVAEILPDTTRTALAQNGGYNSRGMLSAYLWSHFADLMNDPAATDAYRRWAALIQPSSGMALDVGCATGRISFEMSTSHQKVVGIDTSHAFVEHARRLLRHRRVDFDLIVEGRITDKKACQLNADWRYENIEFIVADAMALPFSSRLFATVSSINVLEKVGDPLRHLGEVNRVLADHDAQFVFSDPFSWDETVSPPERWIGGKTEGPHAGRGMAVMRRLFAGQEGLINPVLDVVEDGTVFWKIRKTENLWEHITSQYLLGRR